MVTCVCGVLDYRTGRLTLANAGHMPVLVVRAGGQPEWVTAESGLPLGVRDFATYEELAATVAPGDTIVMFTDGLVERRHETIDARLEVLAGVAADAIGLGGDWCDRVVQRMIGSRREDDVAVLGVRIDRLAVRPLSIRAPAEPARLRSVRREFRDWLAGHGVDHDDAESLLLAVGEAIANVIVHAYDGRAGELRVDATLDEGRLHVRVEDDGQWRPPRDDEGRGLQIIRGLCEQVEIVSGAGGTMLTFARQLRTGNGQTVQ
jgi:anti-sigma regulatory factor (Ser/Thr protein kinase)